LGKTGVSAKKKGLGGEGKSPEKVIRSELDLKKNNWGGGRGYQGAKN